MGNRAAREGEKRRQALGWQDSHAWGAGAVAIYVILAALPLVAAVALQPAYGAPILTEIGKGAGLLGFGLLALQVATASRIRLFERPFGLDMVTYFHKQMAIFAGALLLLHPVMIALGYGYPALLWSETPFAVDLGKAALAILVGGILFALGFRLVRLDYNTWRVLHKGMFVVVILGFLHGLRIGSGLRPWGARLYWWTLFLAACAVFAYRNLYIPLLERRRYRVATVRRETHDTFTIELESEDGCRLAHLPGQFLFLILKRPGRRSEQHPFTISSSPAGEGPLTVTIKKSGDFTGTIDQTRSGDRALVEGPFGRYSYLHRPPTSLIFIAGGVGITPHMSMLRCLRDSGDGRSTVLICGNDTEGDIIFRKELDELPSTARVVHVLADPPEGWKGETGYVTGKIIGRHAGNLLREADIYLCGPPPMMKAVVKSLRGLGVEDGRIRYERFAI